MASIIERIVKEKLVIDIPDFVVTETKYETIMGSMAYGVKSEDSDWDIYGFCMPPKDMVFPHLSGEIEGFGEQKKRFEQYQQHHIKDKAKDLVYDMNIYNVVKYFHLCMQNNPNMIDSLFTADNYVISGSQISDHVRKNRLKFLHKGSWHRFKGYAYQQLHKMRIKKPEETSNRYEMVQKHGYDLKFAYHVVRLLNEVEQIMTEGDLDLLRNREQLKSIRRGDWKLEEIEGYFTRKETELETLYNNSKLPWGPDEAVIKQILIDCLEMHYGDLSFVPSIKSQQATQTLREVYDIVRKQFQVEEKVGCRSCKRMFHLSSLDERMTCMECLTGP